MIYIIYFTAMMTFMYLNRADFTPVMGIIWIGVTFTMSAVVYAIEHVRENK